MHGILTTMFTRLLQNRLPKTSFFLFGARQVGKSALLKKLNPDLSIDLLNPELQLSYNKNPNRLQHEIDEKDCHFTVLIDEVQRAPRLLDVVHAIMEEKPR